MEKHFSRHITNLITGELRIPYDPVPATKINEDLGLAFIHWQGKAITLYSPLVSKGFSDCFSQCNTCVFNRMMFVNMQVALRINGKINQTMPRNLLQHMIEETESCFYTGL